MSDGLVRRYLPVKVVAQREETNTIKPKQLRTHPRKWIGKDEKNLTAGGRLR
jgi:hypothetical protein